MNKLITGKKKFLFAWFGIGILLALSTITVVWADPNSAYCVKMGYLYRTTPSLNDGNGICQFPDGTWCDAHEFFKGDCRPASYASYGSFSMRRPVDASSMCSQYGGRIHYVHTIYGDVPLCVLPDGSTIELAPYSGLSDAWAHYAYNWLNAP